MDVNNIISIEEIRELLKRWYDAEATDQEEWILIDWFFHAHDKDIPEDLRPDAKIFRSMSYSCDFSIGEIEKNIRTAIISSELRKKRILWSRIGSVAAAILIIFVVLAPFVGLSDRLVSENSGENILSLVPVVDTVVRTDTFMAPAHELPVAVSHGRINEKQACASFDDSGKISSEDSIRLLNKAYSRLDAAFRITQKNKKKVEDKIRSVETMINSTIQQIVSRENVRPEILDKNFFNN